MLKRALNGQTTRRPDTPFCAIADMEPWIPGCFHLKLWSHFILFSFFRTYALSLGWSPGASWGLPRRLVVRAEWQLWRAVIEITRLERPTGQSGAYSVSHVAPGLRKNKRFSSGVFVIRAVNLRPAMINDAFLSFLFSSAKTTNRDGPGDIQC